MPRHLLGFRLTNVSLTLLLCGRLVCCLSPLELKLAGITGEKLDAQFEALAALSDTPRPSVTRLVFSDWDVQARRLIKDLMKDAQLDVREDIMGNIFGRWEGAEKAAVMSGSHSDSIVLGGAYDGDLGVVGAIAAIKALQEEGFRPQKSIEAVMFTTEEASRFNVPCLGSQGMTGYLNDHTLDNFKDENGTTFREAAARIGYKSSSNQELLRKAKIDPASVAAFVELHIEQGPLLEKEGVDIGIVEAILAPSLLTLDFSGSGGHGGGMPMSHRNDPCLAASELALRAEQAAFSTKAFDTVVTTGIWKQEPNIFNAVPRSVHLEIDVRDTEGDRRDEVIQQIFDGAEQIAANRKCSLSKEIRYAYPIAKSDKTVLSAIQRSTDKLGLSSKRLISRPYHDAAFMAQIAHTAMIFTPCKRGLSHHPEEEITKKHMVDGVKTLAYTIAQLAGSAEPSQDKSEL